MLAQGCGAGAPSAPSVRRGSTCDDGTVLGASLAAQEIRQHELTWLWEMDLRLENGFLVED